MEKYETPEVITFSGLDFEPAQPPDGQCISLFTCELKTFAPG